MNRDEMIAEIKAQLLAELEGYKNRIQSQIPPEAQEKFEQTRDQGRQLIRENPLVSVAIAAGIGFLLGRFFYRQGEE